MLSVVSCSKKKGEEQTDDALLKFSEMLASSVPNSSETVVTHIVNESVIENTFSVVTGTVIDAATGESKKAAVYKSSVSTLGKVEDRNLDLFRTKEENVWYLEGSGTSTNKGIDWKAEGKDFSPVAGSLAMNLKSSYIKSQTYSKEGSIETLKLTMTAENATLALANFLDGKQTIKYDVTVTITAAAERISSIVIKYVVPEHDIGTEESPVVFDDVEITIEANYSYKTDTGDIPITLG